MDTALTIFRVKRVLLVVGLLMLAIGFATHIHALTGAGLVFAVAGFVSAGGV